MKVISCTMSCLALLTSFVAGAELHVPAGYPTLQEAVDAASSGDTIHIAPGVHTGQTRILSKDLTLLGKPGAVLRATQGMTRFGGDISHVPMLGIFRCHVVISGLSFEGEQLAGDYPSPDLGDLMAVYFIDAGGSVENCRFMGFREKSPGSEGAVALRFFNDLDNASLVDVRVVGNTFLDNYDGITLVGAATNRSINFTIKDNTISSVGPSPHEFRAAGISIGAGAAGEVSGNTISGHACTDPTLEFPFSWGIAAFDLINVPPLTTLEPILIKENTLRDNQLHINILLGDQSIIANNSIEGTPPGTARPTGILVSGQNVNITGNCLEALENGVILFGDDLPVGDDPGYGTILGTAVDAILTDNKFGEDVPPVTIQDLASGTETGSLYFPFPEPELDIARAVLLSWPDFYDDYSVESASDPAGTWTLLAAPSFLQDGMLKVAVPVEADKAFFRLRKP
jgi:hypothetical protein